MGNIIRNPRTGLLFVDFEDGTLLSLTGQAGIVWDGPELESFIGAARLLKFCVEVGFAIPNAVPLRWSEPEFASQLTMTGSCLHLPLHRESDVYQREGIDLHVSMLADWVGGSAATLMPLVDAIRSHVFAAERIHADDTTVPVLANGKTRTGRLWTYVRDDRPFAGPDPPAAVFFYSPDRGGVHPEQHLAGYAGLMQADAYAGFGRLYEANCKADHRGRVLGARQTQVL